MDIIEQLARQAAETINGGEFYDGKWYTEGQRQAWRKAMTPAATEIERLRDELQSIADVSERWTDSLVSQINEMAHKALKGKE